MKKSHTDLKESEKLAKILPRESADMYYISKGMDDFGKKYYSLDCEGYNDDIRENDIPCWSLTALFELLPDEITDNHFPTLYRENKEYCCCYEDINGNSSLHYFADNPIDAVLEMIIKLKEKNLL